MRPHRYVGQNGLVGRDRLLRAQEYPRSEGAHQVVARYQSEAASEVAVEQGSLWGHAPQHAEVGLDPDRATQLQGCSGGVSCHPRHWPQTSLGFGQERLDDGDQTEGLREPRNDRGREA